MTRTEHQHPPRRTTRALITAVLGGVVLAASVMFGTAVGPAAAETPVDIIFDVCGNYVPNPEYMASTDCSGRDLSGVNLTGVNLNFANLTGANLTGATLNCAELNGAHLTDATLTGANLTGANLFATILNDATLAGADLTGATLFFAKLTGATLTNADLTNADLTNADLTNADLTGANLTGANLTGATLTNANLTNANLTGSSLIPSDITVSATSAAGTAVTWSDPTMPTGLTFGACDQASTAVFAVGTTTVTCTAGNGRGAGSGTFTVTVTPYLEAPSFVDPPMQPLTAVAGTPFTHTFTVAGTPDLVLTAVGLPDWLDFSPTGVLTGTPPAAGSFPFTITADNEVGTPATLEVTVTVAAAPVIDPPATGSVGSLNAIFGFAS